MSHGYSELIIEKGIPIPKSKRGHPKGVRISPSRDYASLFDEMDIGDSFSIPLREKREYYKYYQSVMDSARRANIKMTCRNLETEIRFWKLKE